MTQTTPVQQSIPRRTGHRPGDGSVLVGVDSSVRSRGAVQWAAADADARSVPLHLLHVIDERRIPSPIHPLMTDDEHGWKLLGQLVSELTGRYPELVVRPDLASGSVPGLLLSRSEAHAAIVVGRRGSGSFVRMLIGSTALRVASEAPVPVVVVPDDWAPGETTEAPVVLGVDFRDVQAQAVRFALTEAERRKVRLVVAHGDEIPALDWDVANAPVTPAPVDATTITERLAHAIEPYLAEFPEVEVEFVSRHAHPLTVLLDDVGLTQLLVVGRHGKRGGGLPFGSVARAVLHYAEVPVAVVPAGLGATGEH